MGIISKGEDSIWSPGRETAFLRFKGAEALNTTHSFQISRLREKLFSRQEETHGPVPMEREAQTAQIEVRGSSSLGWVAG